MRIYINKNNQQLGPFDEAKVLEMLGNGQLSPNDLAIRHGEKEWQTLSNFFPNIGNTPVAQVAVAPAVVSPKKSRKGLLLGCGGFFLLGLLAAGVLGFLGYRNMNPPDSVEDLPDTVKDLKLTARNMPKGNIWGTQTTFFGLYSNDTKTNSILYLIDIYSDESAARSAMLVELGKSCKTGETPMNFSFLKNGVEMSQGSTCAVPLYIRKGNKLVTIGGSGATADDFIEFAENLPFNEGAKMTKKEK
jgi:hypothetical protein